MTNLQAFNSMKTVLQNSIHLDRIKPIFKSDNISARNIRGIVSEDSVAEPEKSMDSHSKIKRIIVSCNKDVDRVFFASLLCFNTNKTDHIMAALSEPTSFNFACAIVEKAAFKNRR